MEKVSLERKKRLEKELARFLPLFANDPDTEQVIMFGSMASGMIHEWSDIDLVIVRRTNLRFIERLHEMRKMLRPQVGTDFVVYTPKEFDELRKERLFVKQEIIAKGRIVYERGRKAVA